MICTIRRAFAAALFVACGTAQQFDLGEALRREPPKQTAPPRATADFAIPAGSWYDTSNRMAVAQGYIGDYLPTRAVPTSWTGSMAAGDAGDTSPVYRNAAAQRVNWFRAMAGVPAWIAFDSIVNSKAQKGALMLAANNALSHTPPATWQFYTPEGAEALGKSNLCQGFEWDPGCVEQYIADQGSNNAAAGHRRWILYPQTKLMGTGDVPYNRNLWNALWILDASFGSPRPATRDEFVAWPPKGYVPYQVVFPRWSFSYPGAGFSAATVTMTRGGQSVPLRIELAASNIGENTIVWVPDNQSVTDWLNPNPPSADTTYTVTIGNVTIAGQPRSFTYEVIVFDPGAGPVFTADPPVRSFGTSGGDGALRILKNPPSASAPAVASAAWITLGGRTTDNTGALVFFYTIAPNTGAARTGTITVGNAVHTIQQAGAASSVLTLNRTTVSFGMVEGTTQFTGAQEVQVNLTGAGPANWSASSNQPWLSVTPSGGSGSGTVTLSLAPAGVPAAGSHAATVTITAGGAVQTVTVPLTVLRQNATAVPIGVVDTPAVGATNLYGAIGVTGWALDDVEVVRVTLWRNPLGGEPVHGNGHVYIGEAVFLEGARPDVAAAFPAYPLNTRGGWGMQVLTNMLPNTNGQPGTGNGTYTLYVYAHDVEGRAKLLGSRMISVNNAASVRPFGTLDAPGNGEEVSGIITVFGWALTPQPGVIPSDGSTMWVFVDGAVLGRPGYGHFRPDIATLFPGYVNANGAAGAFVLDTTKLTNGLHEIAWSVTDNLGRIEGIGSRLFRVRNTGARQ